MQCLSKLSSQQLCCYLLPSDCSAFSCCSAYASCVPLLAIASIVRQKWVDSSVPSKALFAFPGEQILFRSLCFGSASDTSKTRLAPVCYLALLSLPGTESVAASPSIDRTTKSSLARRGWNGIARSKAVDSPCKLLGLEVISACSSKRMF